MAWITNVTETDGQTYDSNKSLTSNYKFMFRIMRDTANLIIKTWWCNSSPVNH